ncbi:MAG: hypothetical protein ACRCXE_03305 [Metamycoplasmataceae bacterium]
MKKFTFKQPKPFVDTVNGSPVPDANLFEVRKQQEAQLNIIENNIDKDFDIITKYKNENLVINNSNQDLYNNNSQNNLSSFKSTIDLKISEKFNNMVIDPYWIFLKYAEYKVSLLKYECSDPKFSEVILEMLKTTYFIGNGGIYLKKQGEEIKYTAISIQKQIVNIWNETQELTISNGNCSYQRQYKEMMKPIHITNKDEIKNVIPMSWGMFGVGGWINDFKVAQTQGWLLKNLLINVLIQNKKISYSISDPIVIDAELDILFGDNFFIAEGDIQNGTFSSRVKVLENGGQSSLEGIEFYNEYIKILYRDILGRRFNDDEKGERNVTNEVEATQHLFNVLDDVIFTQFKLFEQKLKENELFKSLGISFEIIEPKEIGDANQEKDYNSSDKENNNDSNS